MLKVLNEHYYLDIDKPFYFFWNSKDLLGVCTREFRKEFDRNNWNEEVIIIKKIKYVHQLQNLYFALTGTELKTK